MNIYNDTITDVEYAPLNRCVYISVTYDKHAMCKEINIMEEKKELVRRIKQKIKEEKSFKRKVKE